MMENHNSTSAFYSKEGRYISVKMEVQFIKKIIVFSVNPIYYIGVKADALVG